MCAFACSLCKHFGVILQAVLDYEVALNEVNKLVSPQESSEKNDLTWFSSFHHWTLWCVFQWKMFKLFAFFVQTCSVEQLQHMHLSLSQQLGGSMPTRGNRGSVGSLDGGRLFNDAMAWIAQQKVSERTTCQIRWQWVEQQTPYPHSCIFLWWLWGWFWMSSRLLIQSNVLTLWFSSQSCHYLGLSKSSWTIKAF